MPRSSALLVVASLFTPIVASADVKVDVDVKVRVVEPPPVVIVEPPPPPELPGEPPPVVEPALEPAIEPAPPIVVEPAPEPPLEPPPVAVEPAPMFVSTGARLDGAHSVLARHRWEAELAIEFAPVVEMDGVSGAEQAGLRLSLGRQIGPLRLSLEYGVAKLDAERSIMGPYGWPESEDRDGELTRIGASARYRISAGTSAPPHLTIGFYGEVGVGRQTIVWEAGGESARTDAALGFGVEMAGGTHKMGGIDFGVRFHASPKPENAIDRTHDLSAVLQLGILIGS